MKLTKTISCQLNVGLKQCILFVQSEPLLVSSLYAKICFIFVVMNDIDLKVFHKERLDKWRHMVSLLTMYDTVPGVNKNVLIIWYLQLVLGLSMLDILLSLSYLNEHNLENNLFESNFFARLLCVNYRELFNNINITHKKLFDTFSTNNNDSINSLFLDIKHNIVELNILKSENFKGAEEIRHKLFAHRLGGGMEQTNLMVKINTNYIKELGENLISKLEILFCLLFELSKAI